MKGGTYSQGPVDHCQALLAFGWNKDGRDYAWKSEDVTKMATVAQGSTMRSSCSRVVGLVVSLGKLAGVSSSTVERWRTSVGSKEASSGDGDD